jgi:hypothetical protein
MATNKMHAQSEGQNEVKFVLTFSGGTPSIATVLPQCAAGDISVVDTAPGTATITIKNFKGPQGATIILLGPRNEFTIAAVSSRSYSGDDLSFVVKLSDADLDDSSADEDVNCDVLAVAY